MSTSLKIAKRIPLLRKAILRSLYRRQGVDLQDLLSIRNGRFFFYKIDGVYYPNETLNEFVSFRRLYEKAKNESLYHYEPKKGDIIIDLGAGLGEEAVIYSQLVGKEGRIISVEAEPTVFSVLKETIRKNHLTNIQPVQTAISREPGSVSLDSFGDSYEATFIKEDRKGLYQVEAETITSLINRLGLTRIDLLKVNIEGAERHVVETLTERDYQNIRNIAIACHDFRYQREGNEFFRTRELVVRTLEQNNFQVFRRESPADYLADWIYATHKLNFE